MPVASTDIKLRLSGGASNTDPTLSLGGAKSTVAGGVITTDISNNTWDNVLNAESAAGDVEYRCWYVENAHATLTLIAPVIWIASDTPSPYTTIAIGLGTSPVNGTEQTVANESTAPTGVTFSVPSTILTGLPLGDLPFGQHKAIWARRTVTAGALILTGDAYTLKVQGE